MLARLPAVERDDEHVRAPGHIAGIRIRDVAQGAVQRRDRVQVARAHPYVRIARWCDRLRLDLEAVALRRAPAKGARAAATETPSKTAGRLHTRTGPCLRAGASGRCRLPARRSNLPAGPRRTPARRRGSRHRAPSGPPAGSRAHERLKQLVEPLALQQPGLVRGGHGGNLTAQWENRAALPRPKVACFAPSALAPDIEYGAASPRPKSRASRLRRSLLISALGPSRSRRLGTPDADPAALAVVEVDRVQLARLAQLQHRVVRTHPVAVVAGETGAARHAAARLEQRIGLVQATDDLLEGRAPARTSSCGCTVRGASA